MYYFKCQATKKYQFLTVLIGFLILGVIEDGNHCWWRDGLPAAPPPVKCTSSCWQRRSRAFHWRKNLFKTSKEGSINPLLPLYHVRGMNLRVRPRVKLLCVHEKFQVFWENPLLSTTQPNLAIKRLNRVKNSAKYDSGAPNENIVQNHLNIALLNVF